MKWFRVYSEARTDAKLESLTDAQHRVWFRLMCFAGDQDERGAIIGYDEDLLAVEVARGDVDLLRETLERLVKLRIIAAGDDVRFLNWQSRQYDKPSDAPERVAARVRRHRETKRNADVTPGNALYTDTESDTDPEPEGEIAPAGAPPREDQPHDLALVFLEAIGKTKAELAPAFESAMYGHCEFILTQGFGAERFERYLAYRKRRRQAMDLRWIRQDILQWEADGEPDLPPPSSRDGPREESREDRRARHMTKYGHLFEGDPSTATRD